MPDKTGSITPEQGSKILGVLVGGGPAPGINGVISSLTIEAINNGMSVIGIMDGFKWLSRGDTSHVKPLTIKDVSRIHFQGGSILRTARDNPTKDPKKMENVTTALKELDVKYLVTIGGDDTAYTASLIQQKVPGRIRMVHIPKTIDNDLPLPGYTSTFGFQTARHRGVEIVQTLMEDARTTDRWYFLVSMGRKAGHLALGIGYAAGATLTLIAEEFKQEPIPLKYLCDIIEGSMIKRFAMGRGDGIVVMAEGIIDKLSEDELTELRDVERDEHDHLRFTEVQLGRIVRNRVRDSLASRGIVKTIVESDIGYELRCAPPIPYDIEYTRNLGYGAIKFLLGGESGAMISYQAGKLVPIYFDDMIDSRTGKVRLRLVNVHTESYEVSRKYMIRLTHEDFEDPEQLRRLAEAGKMSESEFVERFKYLV